jgi:hypothetical protein
MRTLLLLCLSLIVLSARENPFQPVIDENVLPITSNTTKAPPPFQKIRVRLPHDARVLNSVVFYYQSIDGSIKNELVTVDRTIDWHKPILITQENRVFKIKTPHPKKRQEKIDPLQSIYHPLPFIAFEVKHNQLKIVTHTQKIRHFHLSHPFKIVIDFAYDTTFLTKHIPLNRPPFKSIDIGNHHGYYRVVITLDAPYQYTIQKREHGYLLDLQ